jgi:hypothetical protein
MSILLTYANLTYADVTMARPGFVRTAWLLLAIVMGAGGYAVGSRQGHQSTIRALQTEAAGNLSQRIEILSLLRMNEVTPAVLRLDAEVDQLTRSIALNAGADRRALSYMKTYLSVVPPSAARTKELSAALDGVPVLEPGQCSSALKALLLSAKAPSAEPGK